MPNYELYELKDTFKNTSFSLCEECYNLPEHKANKNLILINSQTLKHPHVYTCPNCLETFAPPEEDKEIQEQECQKCKESKSKDKFREGFKTCKQCVTEKYKETRARNKKIKEVKKNMAEKQKARKKEALPRINPTKTSSSGPQTTPEIPPCPIYQPFNLSSLLPPTPTLKQEVKRLVEVAEKWGQQPPTERLVSTQDINLIIQIAGRILGKE